MRHCKLKNRLGLGREHRIALLRNLMISLLRHGSIMTTLSKAKALKRFFDKTVTAVKSKQESFNQYRMAQQKLGHGSKDIIQKFVNTNFKRTSGLTSLKKVGFRRGDAASMAVIKILS